MVDKKAYTLKFYTTPAGIQPVSRWLKSIKDQNAKQKMHVRISRLEIGLFGDVESVGGGVHEIRVFVGKGYRLYFATVGNELVLLLNGGDKQSKSQQQRDIALAKEYLNEYKSR